MQQDEAARLVGSLVVSIVAGAIAFIASSYVLVCVGLLSGILTIQLQLFGHKEPAGPWDATLLLGGFLALVTSAIVFRFCMRPSRPAREY